MVVKCDGTVVCSLLLVTMLFVFFFQAEDGIRDAQESRGLGDVYKRQEHRRDLLLLASEAAHPGWRRVVVSVVGGDR